MKTASGVAEEMRIAREHDYTAEDITWATRRLDIAMSRLMVASRARSASASRRCSRSSISAPAAAWARAISRGGCR